MDVILSQGHGQHQVEGQCHVIGSKNEDSLATLRMVQYMFLYEILKNVSGDHADNGCDDPKSKLHHEPSQL